MGHAGKRTRGMKIKKMKSHLVVVVACCSLSRRVYSRMYSSIEFSKNAGSTMARWTTRLL